jgi:NAD(P)-dependent dehydrogenase (short-subunit alcohol dehydrogenase family)
MSAFSASRPPVVLITGASSGIGKACAEVLFARGCRVYGTSRRAPRAVVEARTSDLAPLLRMIPLDVTSDESVAAAVGIVLASEGRIDVLVNNAGFGVAGAVESTTIDEAREQLETNFFGTVRVCQAVLPVMRRQGSGRILNISSIAGQIGIPFQAFYSASKFAVEGLSEALRMEVAAFGIQVVLIEPGDFRTGFTAARRMARAAVGQGFSLAGARAAVGQGFSLAGTQGDPEGSPYLARQAKALAVMEHDETHGATPEAVGRLVYRIITTRSPGVRYAVGPVSEKLALVLRRLLPSRLLAWGIAKYYKVG